MRWMEAKGARKGSARVIWWELRTSSQVISFIHTKPEDEQCQACVGASSLWRKLSMKSDFHKCDYNLGLSVISSSCTDQNCSNWRSEKEYCRGNVDSDSWVSSGVKFWYSFGKNSTFVNPSVLDALLVETGSLGLLARMFFENITPVNVCPSRRVMAKYSLPDGRMDFVSGMFKKRLPKVSFLRNFSNLPPQWRKGCLQKAAEIGMTAAVAFYWERVPDDYVPVITPLQVPRSKTATSYGIDALTGMPNRRSLWGRP